MSLKNEVSSISESLRSMHARSFWERLDALEKRLRELMPFIPFSDRRPGKRLVLGWNGRVITHTTLSLPLPGPDEMETALTALLETAANAAILIERDRVTEAVPPRPSPEKPIDAEASVDA